MTDIILLKLGGSLITDKTRPYVARQDILAQLAKEIVEAREANPGLQLILGHGSGSFGHTAARQYHTRDGFPPSDNPQPYWHGFSEVWFQAATLNRLVMESLHAAGLSALALAPVASVIANNGKVAHWSLTPLRAALNAGLTPVVYGDVIFDEIRGGTILSTEDLFEHLARALQPKKILLAGLEGAVWADFPARTRKVERITPTNFDAIRAGIGASHGADVTGGMESKVRQMLKLTEEIPGLTAQIFSGEIPGTLKKALNGETPGTLIGGE